MALARAAARIVVTAAPTGMPVRTLKVYVSNPTIPGAVSSVSLAPVQPRMGARRGLCAGAEDIPAQARCQGH
jgi:hypothetical protein